MRVFPPIINLRLLFLGLTHFEATESRVGFNMSGNSISLITPGLQDALVWHSIFHLKAPFGRQVMIGYNRVNGIGREQHHLGRGTSFINGLVSIEIFDCQSPQWELWFYPLLIVIIIPNKQNILAPCDTLLHHCRKSMEICTKNQYLSHLTYLSQLCQPEAIVTSPSHQTQNACLRSSHSHLPGEHKIDFEPSITHRIHVWHIW